MEHYRFFENVDCEYYPCHTLKEGQKLNCLFCYCPLYPLGEKCGGDFTYTQKGVKNCKNCTKPHDENGYAHVQSHIREVLEIAKKTNT